jgi:hypothetical protein
VVHVDASAQFLGHLAGVSDPEAKRKIIGKEFVEVFQVESGKLSNAKWLAQGRELRRVALRFPHAAGVLGSADIRQCGVPFYPL